MPRFSSEALLQQAVAGLLSRMPNIQSVQILHGAQEHGKDVVFQTIGPFGEALNCGCVIKNLKISGKLGSKSSARTLLDQVEQALDTPFLDGSGQESRIHRVYVISPEEISQTSISSIKGKLSARSGQVVFINGVELFRLFRTYWLDFFADEHAAVESHFTRLKDRTANQAFIDLVNIYSLGEVEKSEAAIYVERHLFCEIPISSLKSVEEMLIKPYNLQEPLGKTDLEKIVGNTQDLREAIRHLLEWGYIEKGVVDDIDVHLSRFSEEIEEKWVTNARAKLNRPKVSFEQIQSDFRIRVGPDMVGAFEKLSILLHEAFRPISAVCSEISQLQAVQSESLDILVDRLWRLAGSLDECAQHSPRDLFHSRPGLQLRISESALRSSALPILISGAAGFGKTSFCRWNALTDAELFRTGKHKILPTYIPLNSVANSRISGFDDFFLKELPNSGLAEEATSDAELTRVYLDGLDEVPSETKQREVVELIKVRYLSSKNRLQLVITSRDYVAGRWLSWLIRLRLSAFEDSDIRELEKQWFKDDQALVREFHSQMTAVPSLAGLMKVPLMATLVILVFKQTRRLPETKARLYSMFIDLLSGGWDLAKGILRVSRFGRTIKVILLSEIAAAIHPSGRRYFRIKDIESSITRVMPTARAETLDELVKELLVDGVVSRAGELFFFSHLSFQEFLAAKHMLGDPKTNRIESVLAKVIRGDDWWQEVLRFYIGLSENPANVVRWLALELQRRQVDRFHAKRIMAMACEAFPQFDVVFVARQYGLNLANDSEAQ